MRAASGVPQLVRKLKDLTPLFNRVEYPRTRAAHIPVQTSLKHSAKAVSLLLHCLCCVSVDEVALEVHRMRWLRKECIGGVWQWRACAA